MLQVCEEISNDNLKCENERLVEALRFFKFTQGTIVTKNQADLLTIESFKIRLIPAHSFLLEIGT